MNSIVIKHVALNELPAAWRDLFPDATNPLVTVRIEEESDEKNIAAKDDNPLFGIWRDRGDMENVAEYARQIRTSRQPGRCDTIAIFTPVDHLNGYLN